MLLQGLLVKPVEVAEEMVEKIGHHMVRILVVMESTEREAKQQYISVTQIPHFMFKMVKHLSI